MGLIKGDTRSLDYSSHDELCWVHGKNASNLSEFGVYSMPTFDDLNLNPKQ